MAWQPDSTTGHPNMWSTREDDILRREAAKQLLTSDSIGDWCSIASRLPDRTNKDCRKRWCKIGPEIRKGRWTEPEDEQLRQAVERHGVHWTAVAQAVKGRNSDQCAKRWSQSLDPRLDHSKWKPQDDARLLEIVTQQGRNWKTIAEIAFPNRSPVNLKNRYNTLNLKLQSKEQSLVAMSSRSTSAEPQTFDKIDDSTTLENDVNSIGLSATDPTFDHGDTSILDWGMGDALSDPLDVSGAMDPFRFVPSSSSGHALPSSMAAYPPNWSLDENMCGNTSSTVSNSPYYAPSVTSTFSTGDPSYAIPAASSIIPDLQATAAPQARNTSAASRGAYVSVPNPDLALASGSPRSRSVTSSRSSASASAATSTSLSDQGPAATTVARHVLYVNNITMASVNILLPHLTFPGSQFELKVSEAGATPNGSGGSNRSASVSLSGAGPTKTPPKLQNLVVGGLAFATARKLVDTLMDLDETLDFRIVKS